MWPKHGGSEADPEKLNGSVMKSSASSAVLDIKFMQARRSKALITTVVLQAKLACRF